MSDLHERFDALVATLEKTLGLKLDHVKAPAAEAAVVIDRGAPVVSDDVQKAAGVNETSLSTAPEPSA